MNIFFVAYLLLPVFFAGFSLKTLLLYAAVAFLLRLQTYLIKGNHPEWFSTMIVSSFWTAIVVGYFVSIVSGVFVLGQGLSALNVMDSDIDCVWRMPRYLKISSPIAGLLVVGSICYRLIELFIFLF